MSKEKPSNFAASVRQRLFNIIRETGDDANRDALGKKSQKPFFRHSGESRIGVRDRRRNPGSSSTYRMSGPRFSPG